MHKLDESGVPHSESDEDSQVFFADPYHIHYAGMVSPPRPGVGDCFQMLEHTHFAPLTPRTDLFHMRVIDWEGIIWGIVSIPIAEKELMERIAQVNGLRIANGIPIMISGGGMHKFPVDSKNLFVLENIAGHPIYHQSR